MPVIRDRAELDAKLEEQRQKIESARTTAAGWISFYIKDRLIELERLFPGYAFTYSHPVFGTGLTVSPTLMGRANCDDIASDLSGLILNDTQARFITLYEEIGDLGTEAEDGFSRTLGVITSSDELDEIAA